MVSHRAKEFKQKVGAALIICFALTLDTVSVHQTKLDLSHVSVFLSSLSCPRCLTLIQDNWTVEHIPLKTAAALPRHVNAPRLCEASSDEFWRIKNPLVLILFQSSKVEQQEVRFSQCTVSVWQLVMPTREVMSAVWLFISAWLPIIAQCFQFCLFKTVTQDQLTLRTKGDKHDYCCRFFLKKVSQILA